MAYATGIKITDLLLVRTTRGTGRLVLLENLPQYLFIPQLQLACRAPEDLVGRNGILRIVLAAHVLIEVLTRVGRRIDASDINMAELRRHLGRLSRATEKGYSCKERYDGHSH